jgi:hypothetical protein
MVLPMGGDKSTVGVGSRVWPLLTVGKGGSELESEVRVDKGEGETMKPESGGDEMKPKSSGDSELEDPSGGENLD